MNLLPTSMVSYDAITYSNFTPLNRISRYLLLLFVVMGSASAMNAQYAESIQEHIEDGLPLDPDNGSDEPAPDFLLGISSYTDYASFEAASGDVTLEEF